MRLLIFALLCVLLLSIAVARPVSEESEGTCSSECKGGSKFGYVTGKTYHYEYEGTTETGMKGMSGEMASVRMKGTVRLHVISPCEFALSLTDVKLHHRDPESRQLVGANDEVFVIPLEKFPLRFSFDDGRVSHVCPDPSDPVESINVKRALISLFQNSMHRFDGDDTVEEEDSLGICTTKYSLSEGERMVFRKSRNLLACRKRSDAFTSIQSTPYHVASEFQSLPFTRSTHECTQKFDDDKFISQVECKESHLLRPFSRGENGASTTASLSLKHTKTVDLGPIPSASKLIRVPLRHEHSFSGRGITTDEVSNQVTEILNKVCKEVKPDTPGHFSSLLNLLRNLDYPTLKLIHNEGIRSQDRCPVAKRMLLDVLPLIHNEHAVKLIVELIGDKKIPPMHVSRALSSLAFASRPSSSMIEQLLPLLRRASHSTRRHVMFSISSVVNSFCRRNPSCGDDKSVKAVIDHFVGQLGSCKSDDPSKQLTLILALKSLGNMGHAFTDETVDKLKPCLSNDAPLEIQLSGIQSLRRAKCSVVPLKLLMSILTSQMDTESRIWAYVQLMRCPSEIELREVYSLLEDDKCPNQIRSFIWTHLTELMGSSTPLKSQIYGILHDERLGKKIQLDPLRFSSYKEVSGFSKRFNLGANVERGVIYSSKSMLPRSGFLNMSVDVFGNSVNLFEIGGRIEGLEEKLESIWAPKPEDEESLHRERRSVNPFVSKLKEIRRNGYKQPQMGLSAYAKMFGTEMGYVDYSRDKNQIESRVRSALDMMKDLKKKGNWRIINNHQFLASKISVPTSVGLPMSLSLQGTASIDFNLKGNLDFRKFMDELKRPKNMAVDIEFNPSSAVEMIGTMDVSFAKRRAGVRMVSNIHSSVASGIRIRLADGKKFSASLSLPKEKMDIINAKTKFFVDGGSGKPKQLDNEGKQLKKNMCSGKMFTRMFGLSLCTSLSVPNPSSKSGPYFPFTGPASLSVTLKKEEPITKYKFESEMHSSPSMTRRLVKISTPGSKINRNWVVKYYRKPTKTTLNVETPLEGSPNLKGESIQLPNRKTVQINFNSRGKVVVGFSGRWERGTSRGTTRQNVSITVTGITDEKIFYRGSYTNEREKKRAANGELQFLPLRFWHNQRLNSEPDSSFYYSSNLYQWNNQEKRGLEVTLKTDNDQRSKSQLVYKLTGSGRLIVGSRKPGIDLKARTIVTNSDPKKPGATIDSSVEINRFDSSSRNGPVGTAKLSIKSSSSVSKSGTSESKSTVKGSYKCHKSGKESRFIETANYRMRTGPRSMIDCSEHLIWNGNTVYLWDLKSERKSKGVYEAKMRFQRGKNFVSLSSSVQKPKNSARSKFVIDFSPAWKPTVYLRRWQTTTTVFRKVDFPLTLQMTSNTKKSDKGSSSPSSLNYERSASYESTFKVSTRRETLHSVKWSFHFERSLANSNAVVKLIVDSVLSKPTSRPKSIELNYVLQQKEDDILPKYYAFYEMKSSNVDLPFTNLKVTERYEELVVKRSGHMLPMLEELGITGGKLQIDYRTRWSSKKETIRFEIPRILASRKEGFNVEAEFKLITPFSGWKKQSIKGNLKHKWMDSWNSHTEVLFDGESKKLTMDSIITVDGSQPHLKSTGDIKITTPFDGCKKMGLEWNRDFSQLRQVPIPPVVKILNSYKVYCDDDGREETLEVTHDRSKGDFNLDYILTCDFSGLARLKLSSETHYKWPISWNHKLSTVSRRGESKTWKTNGLLNPKEYRHEIQVQLPYEKFKNMMIKCEPRSITPDKKEAKITIVGLNGNQMELDVEKTKNEIKLKVSKSDLEAVVKGSHFTASRENIVGGMKWSMVFGDGKDATYQGSLTRKQTGSTKEGELDIELPQLGRIILKSRYEKNPDNGKFKKLSINLNNLPMYSNIQNINFKVEKTTNDRSLSFTFKSFNFKTGEPKDFEFRVYRSMDPNKLEITLNHLPFYPTINDMKVRVFNTPDMKEFVIEAKRGSEQKRFLVKRGPGYNTELEVLNGPFKVKQVKIVGSQTYGKEPSVKVSALFWRDSKKWEMQLNGNGHPTNAKLEIVLRSPRNNVLVVYSHKRRIKLQYEGSLTLTVNEKSYVLKTTVNRTPTLREVKIEVTSPHPRLSSGLFQSQYRKELTRREVLFQIKKNEKQIIHIKGQRESKPYVQGELQVRSDNFGSVDWKYGKEYNTYYTTFILNPSTLYDYGKKTIDVRVTLVPGDALDRKVVLIVDQKSGKTELSVWRYADGKTYKSGSKLIWGKTERRSLGFSSVFVDKSVSRSQRYYEMTADLILPFKTISATCIRKIEGDRSSASHNVTYGEGRWVHAGFETESGPGRFKGIVIFSSSWLPRIIRIVDEVRIYPDSKTLFTYVFDAQLSLDKLGMENPKFTLSLKNTHSTARNFWDTKNGYNFVLLKTFKMLAVDWRSETVFGHRGLGNDRIVKWNVRNCAGGESKNCLTMVDWLAEVRGSNRVVQFGDWKLNIKSERTDNGRVYRFTRVFPRGYFKEIEGELTVDYPKKKMHLVVKNPAMPGKELHVMKRNVNGRHITVDVYRIVNGKRKSDFDLDATMEGSRKLMVKTFLRPESEKELKEVIRRSLAAVTDKMKEDAKSREQHWRQVSEMNANKTRKVFTVFRGVVREEREEMKKDKTKMQKSLLSILHGNELYSKDIVNLAESVYKRSSTMTNRAYNRISHRMNSARKYISSIRLPKVRDFDMNKFDTRYLTYLHRAVVGKFGRLVTEVQKRMGKIRSDILARKDVKDFISSVKKLKTQLKWLAEYLDLPERMERMKMLIKKEIKEQMKYRRSAIDLKTPEPGRAELTVYLPKQLKDLHRIPDSSLKRELNRLHNLYGHHIYSPSHGSPHFGVGVPSEKVIASVGNSQHFLTFDGHTYDFRGTCSYLLAHDFKKADFALVGNYKSEGGKYVMNFVTLLVSDKFRIDVSDSGSVKVDGKKKELPHIVDENTSLIALQHTIIVSDKRGFKLIYDIDFKSCSLEISKWYLGRVGGLFGTFDNEHSNEYTKSDGKLTNDLNEFTTSWEVPLSGGSSQCRHDNRAIKYSTTNKPKCLYLFSGWFSPLKKCFKTVPVKAFMNKCLADYHPRMTDSCCSAAAWYVNICSKKGIHMKVPKKCRREDACRFQSGPSRPGGADVMIVMEERKCNKLNSNTLVSLVKKIDASLGQKGLRRNMFALVGIGCKKFKSPHVHTFDGGMSRWTSSSTFHSGTKNLMYGGPSIVNLNDALKRAMTYRWRPFSNKMIILASCSSSCSGSSLPSIRELQRRDIKVHLLSDIYVGRPADGSNRTPSTSNPLYGYDKVNVYKPSDVQTFTGHRAWRETISTPTESCARTIESYGGSVFSTSLLNNKNHGKKVIEVMSQRVTRDLSPVMRGISCSCDYDRYGWRRSVCKKKSGFWW